METKNSWVPVTNFQFPNGWQNQAAERARSCCQQLEDGDILFFDGIPFDFPETDRQFLLSQRQSDSGLHKNISYRPKQDLLRGSAAGKKDFTRLQDIMRRYSKAVVNFLSQALSPYAGKWSLDFASFRPEEEKGRDLPLHKRNDLLHLDSFPTRPTHGARILRCFTNINPTDPRIWLTTDRLPVLAQNFARRAGLELFASRRRSRFSPLITGLKKAVGMKAVEHSAYDKFMLRFHDYLKENSEFQKNCPKIRLEFPPVSTWICYTDSVPHAVLSGQYALEQTFIVPISAMVTPEKSPLRILEKMAGRPLAEENN
ncbi:MAG: Kdo hydroxylase family protein [Limisphaerales bacterium]